MTASLDRKAGPEVAVISDRAATKSLSVVIPAYNEEATIEELVVGIVKSLSEQQLSYEIVVVDDGSEDKTLEILRSLKQDHPETLRVVQHLYNKGNGAALRTGVRVAQGEIVVSMDADGQHAPSEISKLISLMPPYDLVIGCRTKGYQGPRLRGMANRFFNRFASWLSKMEVLDLTSGFRAMRRSTVMHFLPLFPTGFSAPSTTTLAFLKAGYNVAFVPVTVGPRAGGKSKISLWADGTRFVVLILRMIMLYDPLRIFFPASLLMGFLGIVAWMAGVITAGRLVLPNSAIFLFISALITSLLGLVANQIAGSLIQYRGDETIVIEGTPEYFADFVRDSDKES